MGNRFEHLEFDDESLRRTEQEQQQPQASNERPGVLSSAAMDRHAYYDKALEAFHRGEFERALRSFTRTLELDRAFVPAWVGQVQMLIEMGELREADLWADKALELFKSNGDLLSAKAVARAHKGDRSVAMATSDAGLAARGSSAYRWLARGDVLLACNASTVEPCFERAFLEPDADWFTFIWAARIYRRYNRHTNAMVAARKGSEAAPHAPYAWYIRGLCERDLAFASCAHCFERAIELDGTFHLARSALREGVKVSWLRRMVRRVRRS